jgi:hypothetical protein
MTTPDCRAALMNLLDAITVGDLRAKDSKAFIRRLKKIQTALLAAPEVVGELQWPASVAQGCHEAAAEAEPGSPMQQLLVATGDLQFSHPTPVPVGERLPGVDDCLVQNTGPDGEPEWWCWFYRPGLEGTAEWRWNTTPRLSEWYGWQGVTYWLPHWALPLPEAQP